MAFNDFFNDPSDALSASVRIGSPCSTVSATVNGKRYFQYGGVWYQPFYSGSDAVYVTVANLNG